MKEFPLVSILIIHYNRPDTLEQCIALARRNIHYPHLEFILADDGSKPEIVERIRQLPFDEFILSEKNTGLGANTNRGVAACKGEYIFQFQDDHFLQPGFEDFVAKAMKILQQHNNKGLVRPFLNKAYSSYKHLQLDEIAYKEIDKRLWKNGYNGFHQHSELPHFKHKSYHQVLGKYAEGIKMIDMENDFCIRFMRAKNYHLYILDRYENIFQHKHEYSFRQEDLKRLYKRTFYNRVRNFIKQRFTFLRTLKFYWWIWSYEFFRHKDTKTKR